MSNSVTFVDNTFNGQAAGQFILDCVSENQTVQGGHIYLQTGFNKKITLPRFRVGGNLIQDYTPTPTAQGQLNISEVTLPLFDNQVYLEFHPNEFRDFWEPYQPSPDQPFTLSTLPTQVLADMTSQIIAESGFDVAQCIWMGNRGASPAPAYPLDRFVGIIPQLENSADTINLSGAVTLTSANILDKLQDVYLSIPKACLRRQDMKIFVSTGAAQLYQEALVATSGKGPLSNTADPLDTLNFKGVRVVSTDEFPENTIVAAESGTNGRTSNFHFGATNIQNESIVQVNRVQANSELYFMKLIFNAGTAVAKPDEVVLYKA